MILFHHITPCRTRADSHSLLMTFVPSYSIFCSCMRPSIKCQFQNFTRYVQDLMDGFYTFRLFIRSLDCRVFCLQSNTIGFFVQKSQYAVLTVRKQRVDEQLSKQIAVRHIWRQIIGIWTISTSSSILRYDALFEFSYKVPRIFFLIHFRKDIKQSLIW